jgi:hypothetical protein
VLKGLPVTELSPDEAILHALNRLSYGPRPGDVERVRQVGLAKWIDSQLKPASLDDKPLEVRLENLPTLRLSATALIRDYPQPKQAAKQAAAAQTRAAAAVPAREAQAGRAEGSPGMPKTPAPGENDAARSGDAPSPMKAAIGKFRDAGRREACCAGY